MKRSIRNLFLASRSPSRRVPRLALVALEDRCTPATFTVTNPIDDGSAESLRGRIESANNSPEDDLILFDLGPAFVGPLLLTRGELIISDTKGLTEIIGFQDVRRDAAAGNFRIFAVEQNARASFFGLTISNGQTNAAGGGIFNAGNLALVLVSVVDNESNAGGGIYNGNTGNVVIIDSDITGNDTVAEDGFGGGILNDGKMALFDSDIDNNFGVAGGGFSNRGEATMDNVFIANNESRGNGGGIGTFENSKLTLDNCRIETNFAVGDGGGIANSGALTISNSDFVANIAEGNGGGIRNSETGTVGMAGVTLSQNTGRFGGGFFNDGFAGLSAVAFVENTATEFGGGVFNKRTATLTNATLSGNKANFGGGGIASNIGTATLTNVTVTANRAVGGSGGGFNFQNEGRVTLFNTIVAGNFKGGDGTTAEDVFGTIEPASMNNLIGDAGSAGGLTNTNGNLVGVDAKLGLLADNGGETLTHALLPESPAINAGDQAKIPAGITRDQRGLVRVSGTNVDIGAFEVQERQTVTITPTTLPDGKVGTAYNQQLAATFPGQPDGTTYTFTANTALPAGLSLSQAGVISGTPTVSGTSKFEVAATANSGEVSARTTITITTRPSNNNIAIPTVTITPASLPAGTVGTAYNQQLAASFPNQLAGTTYRFEATGKLPDGLSLSPAGLISGTPTAAVRSTFQVVAIANTNERSAPKSYTISTSPRGANPTSKAVLVGFREFAAGTDVGASNVNFYNPDGSTKFSLSPFPGFTGGVRTAAADFNGDNIADLVVGTGPGRATRVVVIDGATQKELFAIDPFEAAFTGGVFVATGDLNGDGKADLVITPDQGGGPRARVFSGDGFKQLADFFGIEDVNFRGGARAAVGDINGDGKADVVVAAGFGGGPRIGAFDGVKIAAEGNLGNQTFTRWNTWKLFGDFLAFEVGLRNGTFVAAGDINGDGKAEVLAGGGPGGGPRVSAFSGAGLLTNQQTRIADFFAGDTASRGGIRVAVKNLDGDNKADVVVGAGTGAGSRVTAYTGAALLAAPGAPAELRAFEAVPGFTGGVFVG